MGSKKKCKVHVVRDSEIGKHVFYGRGRFEIVDENVWAGEMVSNLTGFARVLIKMQKEITNGQEL